LAKVWSRTHGLAESTAIESWFRRPAAGGSSQSGSSM